MEARQQVRHGVIAGLSAYLVWGLVPVFFKQLQGVPANEIIAHRVLWSLLFMTAVLALGPGFKPALAVARIPAQLSRIAVAAALVLVNWLIFVYGVNTGRILETSLGYFILPLFNVALGVFVLKEKLRRLQWLAVFLAASGVAIEAFRVGGLPWISLALALTFGLYGLMRKRLQLDAASGLFLETVCITPFAALYLLWLGGSGQAHFGQTTRLDLLLVSTGVVTAVPLLLFAIAARRLPLNMMGFLQYLAPSLSFAVAVLIYDEPLSLARAAGFIVIWIGLAVYSIDLLRQSQK
jgi:chloramphenicol-sensitive protein RarD